MPPFLRSICLAALGVLFIALPAFSAPPLTERVSIRSNGGQTIGGNNSFADITPSGRYVSFTSNADNVVPEDTADYQDIFRHDRETGKTKRVSLATSGAPANGHSSVSAISDDGTVIAFSTQATNLSPKDDATNYDIYVRDLATGKTKLVSVNTSGTEGSGTSGTTAISGNGRFVAFVSDADDLVPDDDNAENDVFIRDLVEGETTRISVASDETEGADASGAPTVSETGRYVAFESLAENLVAPSLANTAEDVFLRDRQKGKTKLVSINPNLVPADGSSSSPAISSDGQLVAFESGASNLFYDDGAFFRDIFVKNTRTGKVEIISVPADGSTNDGSSFDADISANGRYVSFESESTKLVTSMDTLLSHAFVYDRVSGLMERVSSTPTGQSCSGANGSYVVRVSSQGPFVSFESDCTDIVANDTNGNYDAFVVGPVKFKP